MLKELPAAQILIAIVLLMAGFVFGAAWERDMQLLKQAASSDDDAEMRIETIESNDFTLTAKYQGASSWEYSVTGVLPNKCIRYDVTETVAESMPEQVTVSMVIFEPEDDTLCAQVLQDVEESGSFEASEEAEISFKYSRENGRASATGLGTKNEN